VTRFAPLRALTPFFYVGVLGTPYLITSGTGGLVIVVATNGTDGGGGSGNGGTPSTGGSWSSLVYY